jgi:PI31 proteasome regulator N-terminal
MAAEAESLAPRIPPQWCESLGSISFHYKHKQSSMTFIIRIDRMGEKVETRGLAVGDENIHRFELRARNVIHTDSLPLQVSWTEDGVEDRSDFEGKLHKLFVSEDALTSMLS